MLILHVLSQYEVTGAETAVAALVKEQLRRGDKVAIVSDTFTKKVQADVFTLPIGKRDVRQRMKNVIALRKIISSLSVDVVHAHSRAASWVSFFATRGSKVPLISTIHGRQGGFLSSKLYNIYGEKILPVCEAIRQQLISELGYDPKRVSVIRNGIDIEEFQPGARRSIARQVLGLRGSTSVVALIARLSGPKADVALAFVERALPHILEKECDVCLLLVGGKTIPDDLAKKVERLNSQAHRRVLHLLGYQDDVRYFIEAADVVVGSGRVALEAMALERAVIALGESNHGGIVRSETAGDNLSTNFGDCSLRREVEPQEVTDDIVELLRKSELRQEIGTWGRQFVSTHFNITSIATDIDEAYEAAILEKQKLKRREIPVLMYHRIVDSPHLSSRHGTWVTKSDFETQMDFLNRHGFHTLTFSHYLSIRGTKGVLPRRPIMITFDDGYLDNYKNAYPVLKKYGMRATVFLVANSNHRVNDWDARDGEPLAPLLSKDEILEMTIDGIEFGSHTMNHLALDTLPEEKLEEEVLHSKCLLEETLGTPVRAFCYPYGKLNEKIKRVVKNAGYCFATASNSGPNFLEEDHFEIRRIQIFPRTSLFGFWKKTSGWYHRYRKFFGR